MIPHHLLNIRLFFAAVLFAYGFWGTAASAQTFVRIENRYRPAMQVNVEAGPVTASQTQPSWWSADWVFEPTGAANTYRIKNRYKGTYLNIEKSG